MAAAALTAGLIVAGGTGTASAATTVEIHQSDFIPALSDTRSAGHYDFTADGLHVWTDDATSQAKAAEYFALTGSLADMVGSTPPVWTGTSPAPGSQIVFDADGTTGNGNDYNILVGESVYGGSDWWATSGSWVTKNNVCPETGGGFGSACHGTLAQWAAALPGAMVYAGGFSLGSGVLGDGVLTSLTFGTTEYRFVHGLGACDVSEDYPSSTFTLTADCVTDRTLWVRDGWTVDGAGHKITATETPTTTFSGAVLQNLGSSMNVKNLIVTTSGWDDASKSSDANLSGIRLLAASGNLTNVTVDGISHPNGTQGGRAIYVDNRLVDSPTKTVNITDATVTNYQKNGIDVRGDVNVTVSDSVVGAAGSPSGAPQDSNLAANAIVIGFGANGTVRGSHITGNDWDGLTSDNATGVLAYSAGDVTIEHNVIDGAGTDVGVYVQDSDSVMVQCNLITRTADNTGGTEQSDTGVYRESGNASAVDNTITGFGTATHGVTNVVNQGTCLPATPTVSTSAVTQTSANVSWSGAALAYAPVTGWEVVGPKGIVTLPAATTTYALTGLQAGRDYNVSVRAINVSGVGTAGSADFTTATTPPVVNTSTLKVAPTKVVYKSSTTASGVLKAGANGVSGRTVTVWRLVAGAWAKVGSATTAANGTWSLTFKPVVSSSLQATAAGFPTANASITVALKVKAKAKTHAVKAKVSPTVAGGKVVLQKWTNGHWKKVTKGTLSATSKVKFNGLSKGKYRVVAKKAPGFVKGTSATVHVKP